MGLARITLVIAFTAILDSAVGVCHNRTRDEKLDHDLEGCEIACWNEDIKDWEYGYLLHGQPCEYKSGFKGECRDGYCRSPETTTLETTSATPTEHFTDPTFTESKPTKRVEKKKKSNNKKCKKGSSKSKDKKGKRKKKSETNH